MGHFEARLATDDDKLRVLEWRNHRDVRAMMLSTHVITESEHFAWWENNRSRDDRSIHIVEEDSNPVGVVTVYGYKGEGKSAWWGFYLDNATVTDPSQRVSILMWIEEFILDYSRNALKVEALFCESKAENSIVLAMHERFGFTRMNSAPDGSSQTDADVVFMQHLFPENRINDLKKIYFFGSYNTEFLCAACDELLQAYPRLEYQTVSLDFGQYAISLRDPNFECFHVSNAVQVFSERIEDFLPVGRQLTSNSDFEAARKQFAHYLGLIDYVRKSAKEPQIFVFDFRPHQQTPSSGGQLGLGSAALDELAAEFNAKLLEFCRERMITVLPYAELLTNNGIENSFGNKYWYLARNPFSLEFTNRIASKLVGLMLARKALTARVLVLDLDNTLWGGVIGDDGIKGIQLGGDFPGNVYQDLQSLFKIYSSNGLLLCVCSKNTEAVAMEAIADHPNMVLRPKDFIIRKINWNPKPKNIAEIAKELNIGLASICFIDDNPVERADVKQNFPEVYVPDLPLDPTLWYDFVMNLPELTLYEVSDSDRRRVDLYKSQVKINAELAEVKDKVDYLRELEIGVRLEYLDENNFQRSQQLIQKTNQFNTTTIRYSAKDLSNFMSRNDRFVVHVKSMDKYSKEWEGIAVLVMSQDETSWTIDNFVMSCRVMGRNIENAILQSLAKSARTLGKEHLFGAFVASERNAPVEKLFEDNGFQLYPDKDIWHRSLKYFKEQDFGVSVEDNLQ
ncbi:HAD-IIIC family phosphatase [Cohaesibacter sp. CAU 1516]|uniref:HAD-IIIC family phosphatase n=1 Tax=Cohaesibacter sp. CAU 1516 TaxID=2576038 RepID=UPI0010FDBCCF|nr:HAD-IIIC family phosphatase [Cohaesibacter sp. CAU 1516]TLP42094.1 HAD-IIIC family phosphatase [Cohaesibacter sp. CAU 1516]